MKIYERISPITPRLVPRVVLKTSDIIKVLRGYTLIELLMVIAIMAILFSIGTANYREYARRKEVTNAALLLKGDLRLAQEYALAGRKPNTNPDNDCEDPAYSLDYYTFERIGGTGTGYKVQVQCTKGASTIRVAIKSVELKSTKDINLSKLDGAKSPFSEIYFYPRGKGVGNFAIHSSQVKMTLSKGGASPVDIIVTSAGEIK